MIIANLHSWYFPCGLFLNQGSSDHPTHLWFSCVVWGICILWKYRNLIFDSFRPSNLLVFFNKYFHEKKNGKWASKNSALSRSHEKVIFWCGRWFGRPFSIIITIGLQWFELFSEEQNFDSIIKISPSKDCSGLYNSSKDNSKLGEFVFWS